MDAAELNDLMPETVLLDKELLDRLKMSLDAAKAKALKGEFPEIYHPQRGVYAVKKDDLKVWISGQWINVDKAVIQARIFRRVFSRRTDPSAASGASK